MTIPAADSNWLWVRSRGLCGYPDCAALLIELDHGRLVTQAERAHIRAEAPGGPRYDPGYDNPNRYENLLLLCRRHHHLVDAQPDAYPVELLEQWKEQHEGPLLRVQTAVVAPPPEGARYLRRADLYAALGTTLTESPVIVLTGLSGCGKTQLAADYFRHTDSYSLRLWVRSGDETTRLQDFARSAMYLGLSRFQDESLPDFCNRIRDALESTPGWLIVLDDAPSAEDVDRFVPRRGGHVIVTSKAQAWPHPNLSVGLLERAESLKVLETDPRFRGVAQEQLDAVAGAAGDLVLCLVQLIGYLDATGIPIDDFIRHLETYRVRLLARAAPPDHLAMSVSVSSALERLSENARQLLAALSILAPVPVPLRHTLEPLEPVQGLGPLTDLLTFEDAVAELRLHSLVDRNDQGLSCHEVTQIVVRDVQADPDERAAAMLATALVGMLVPSQSYSPEQVGLSLGLAPHARAVLDAADRFPELVPFAGALVNRLFSAYQQVGESDVAERELRRVLTMIEGAPDEAGLRGSVLHNLSNCAADRGDYAEAVELAQTALDVKVSGGEPATSIALTLGALGTHLEGLGRPQEALALHERAVALLEPEPDPARLADALNDVARVLNRIGRAEEASELISRSLAITSDEAEAWGEAAEARLTLAAIEEEHNPYGALRHADAAVSACESVGFPSVTLAKSFGTRGRLRNALGDFRGIDDIRLALVFFERFEGKSVDYGRALGNLGVGLLALGRESGSSEVAAEALSALRTSRDLLRELLPPDNHTVITAERMLQDAIDLVWL